MAYLADNDERPVVVSRERLRQILAARDVTFQRTKTWKESNDPDRDAKLDRIEEVLEHHPQRCFAFDEFGPLSVRPVGGSCWAPAAHPSAARRTITNSTACDSSTAATRSATMRCGAWCVPANRRPTPSPR